MALHAMGKLAERQVEEAQRRWALLAKECAAARHKLNLLRQYGDNYRAQLVGGGFHPAGHRRGGARGSPGPAARRRL